MRYVVPPQILNRWFFDLEKKMKVFRTSWKELARIFGVSGRTLYEWRLGKSTMPEGFVLFAQNRLKIGSLRGAKKLDDYWSKVKSGKAGGLRRNALYGNPGTALGRSLGGSHSFVTHQKNFASPFRARQIFLPPFSSELAEFIGIVLDDGGIQKRQVVITLHKEDDKTYSRYVAELIRRLFRVKPSIVERRGKNAVDIILSRVAAVQFLQEKGLLVGSKVRQQVDVPMWIKGNKVFESFCVRGLFDTDGCLR